MPWQILHKCHLLQTEPGEYAALLGKRDDERRGPVTKLHCQSCGEELLVDGHELFNEAHTPAAMGLNLPPGFVIAQSRKA